MNQKFEYYIQKVLNKVLLQLLASILLSAILIILATIFRFKIGSYFLPGIYFLLALLVFGSVIINYMSYRRNIWLLKHYQKDKIRVIQRIKIYKKEVETYSYGITTYLFNLFNKGAFKHYDEAIKALKEEDKHEPSI